MEQQIETLQRWIDESSRIVFFGGAGVSTESGIPDFRSVDGLYNQRYSEPPETILSADYFRARPEAFFDFYRDKMLFPQAQPNAAHQKLAQLEQAGKLSAVVTQNIDGLHQKAGSKRVYELHGAVERNHCTRCGRYFALEDWMEQTTGVPRCSCGGIIKPDVVLYGECLDNDVVDGAAEAIRRADLLIIAGTSLVVYPAAGLIQAYQGHRLVLINLQPTSADSQADLVIHGKVGEVLSQIRV
jgi:NAD-dependent deacetylase